jgi:beta-lactamase class A
LPALNSAEAGDERDTTTPAAMLGDMQTILLGKQALSEQLRQQLQDWLIANTTGGEKLRAGIPSNWRVGDKTGSGAHGATNDVAILWPPNNRPPILLAVYMVGSAAARADLNAAFAEIGRLVSNYF